MTTPQWLIALNQTVSALTGGNAYMTLSARAYVRRRDGRGSFMATVLDKLFFWHKEYGGHCRYAYYTDMARYESLWQTRCETPFYYNVQSAMKRHRYE